MVIRSLFIAIVGGTPWRVGNRIDEYKNITMANIPKKQKRNRSSSSSDSSLDFPSLDALPVCNSKSWPRFISIKATPQHSLPKNPFLVAKTIQAVAGELKTVKRLRDDSLLLECINFHQAKNLLSLSQFAGTPILSAPHRTLNSCRGIIRDRERCLQSLSEDEIAEELKPQGISSVKRFSINKDGKTIYTNTYLLTFNSATLPSDIKAGYHNIQVTIYVPNPLRCYTCQQFGHGSRTCKNVPACRRCCSKEHDSDSCSSTPYCCNCKGNHMPSSKQCPAWIRESAINRMKYERNISFPEARKLYNISSPSTSPLQVSYSATVKTVSTRAVSCQTPSTWGNSEILMHTPSLPNNSVQNKPKPRSASVARANQIDYSSQCSLSASLAAIKPYSQSSKSSQPTPKQSSTIQSSSSQQITQNIKSRSRSKGPRRKSSNGAKASSGRLRKGEDDPVHTFNKYGMLEDGMDTDPSPTRSASPSSPRPGRKRSPVKHPKS